MDCRGFVGLSGGDVVCELLAKQGVKHIFGYPGGASLPLLDSLYRAQRFEFILAHHEQGAGHMAEGYYRTSKKPGVVMVTSGPGSSNMVTPMLNALLDGTAIVVICGQVATASQGKGAFQEINIGELARTCTKWATSVQRVWELPMAVRSAFQHAVKGRPGPVLISVPKDIAQATFDSEALEAFENLKDDFTVPSPDPVSNDSANLLQEIDHVADLINHSRCPLICAGNGALANQEGMTLLRQVVDEYRIPAATTLLGLGCFDHDHPLSLGMVGTYGTPCANYAIQSADFILVMGARLDERMAGKASGFAPNALENAKEGKGGIIHFDISPEFLGKFVAPTQVILGDISITVGALLGRLKRTDRADWLHFIQHLKEEYPLQRIPSDYKRPQPLPQEVIAELNQQTGSMQCPVTITTGVGQHQMWAAKYYDWKHERFLVTSGGLGTMGYGLPAAIGCKTARPDSHVICVDGDASFCMSMAELLTASQHGLSVKVIILNNQEQGMISQLQRENYEGRICYGQQDNPDFVRLAGSMNCQGRRCFFKEDLPECIDWLLRCDGPALLEVLIAETEMVPIVPSGQSLDCMKFE
ncbi:thiamine pyrophosphate enzyme, N-terminal TPP binding domain-containing protein [Aspergillus floccosus]